MFSTRLFLRVRSPTRVFRTKSWQEYLSNADCLVFGAAHSDISVISMPEIAEHMSNKGLVYDGRRIIKMR